MFDHSEDELRAFVRANAPYVSLSTADILEELDRRAAKRQARAALWLCVVGLVIAVAALVITALKS